MQGVKVGDVRLNSLGLKGMGPKVWDPFKDGNGVCRQDGPRGLSEVGVCKDKVKE